MIKKPTSLELMQQFEQVKTDISDLNTELTGIKAQLNTKLEIIDAANAYGLEKANKIILENGTDDNNTIIFAHDTDKIIDGHYDMYGETVHAEYVQMPIHVFNVLTESGPIFKDNVRVGFYDTDDTSEDHEDTLDESNQYCNILKHESDITKDDVFKVFPSDKITMYVEMNAGVMLGGVSFDSVEICPYLPGSFDITEIRIYTLDEYLKGAGLVPDRYIYDLNSVGNIRYDFGKTYKLFRIEFDLKLKFQYNGYPFGLKHLYFYSTAANKENDSIVIKIDEPEYIKMVGNDITVITSDGYFNTTTEEAGIKLYMFYENNTLSTPLTTLTELARNIKTFYAEIPLLEPLIGIRFNNVLLR